MPGNTSRAEIQRRVDEVMELIAAGLSRKMILQYVAEKAKWKASERTIDNYIKKADEQFALEAGFDRDKEIGKAKKRYEMLFASCVKVQDYGKAAQVQARLDTLLGLPAEPAAQTVRIEGVDDAQLKVLVEAIKSQGKQPSDVFAALMQVIAENAK